MFSPTAANKWRDGPITILSFNPEKLLSHIQPRICCGIAIHGELDGQLTVEEVRGAVDYLACGKAPGSDDITPDVIKCGKPALLYKFIC